MSLKVKRIIDIARDCWLVRPDSDAEHYSITKLSNRGDHNKWTDYTLSFLLRQPNAQNIAMRKGAWAGSDRAEDVDLGSDQVEESVAAEELTDPQRQRINWERPTVSHLCSNSFPGYWSCVNPNHLHREHISPNVARQRCQNGHAALCPCVPQCIFVNKESGVFLPCRNSETLGPCACGGRCFPLGSGAVAEDSAVLGPDDLTEYVPFGFSSSVPPGSSQTGLDSSEVDDLINDIITAGPSEEAGLDRLVNSLTAGMGDETTDDEDSDEEMEEELAPEPSNTNIPSSPPPGFSRSQNPLLSPPPLPPVDRRSILGFLGMAPAIGPSAPRLQGIAQGGLPREDSRGGSTGGLGWSSPGGRIHIDSDGM